MEPTKKKEVKVIAAKGMFVFGRCCCSIEGELCWCPNIYRHIHTTLLYTSKYITTYNFAMYNFYMVLWGLRETNVHCCKHFIEDLKCTHINWIIYQESVHVAVLPQIYCFIYEFYHIQTKQLYDNFIKKTSLYTYLLMFMCSMAVN